MTSTLPHRQLILSSFSGELAPLLKKFVLSEKLGVRIFRVHPYPLS